MQFIDKGEKKEIIFEVGDTDSEKRMVEQGLAFIRNTLNRIQEVENRVNRLYQIIDKP